MMKSSPGWCEWRLELFCHFPNGNWFSFYPRLRCTDAFRRIIITIYSPSSGHSRTHLVLFIPWILCYNRSCTLRMKRVFISGRDLHVQHSFADVDSSVLSSRHCRNDCCFLHKRRLHSGIMHFPFIDYVPSYPFPWFLVIFYENKKETVGIVYFFWLTRFHTVISPLYFNCITRQSLNMLL